MTKQWMALLDSTLASTGRTVRAVVLILTVAIATGAAPVARDLTIPRDSLGTSSSADQPSARTPLQRKVP